MTRVPGEATSFGPYALPPLTLSGVCFDFTGGTLGATSTVATLVVE